MSKQLKLFIIAAGAMVVLSVGAFVGYIFDSELILKLQLSQETAITFPNDYVVSRSTGYRRKDSIHYEFRFDSEALQELTTSIKATPFFNDTLALKNLVQSKWDPHDPKQPWTMKGIWLETDTTFIFLNAPAIYVGAPNRYIVEARLDKRDKTLSATMIL